jgi:two-component system, chemotaxis family, chemotaxis protein CheY
MSQNPPIKVLVAEDSAVNRKILVHLLSKMGFEVTEYADGQKAWEDFKARPKGHYGCVFSDLMMPELDGLGLLKNIRTESESKDVPFVLLTAVSDKDSILSAKNLSVNGYLLKPVSYDKVKKKVSELFPGIKIPALAS